MSVNKVILVGRLGQNPEVRYTASGAAVANMSLATHEAWTDKSGQKQERTEWHRVVVWGKQAEHCAQYLSKGKQAYVEGRLQTRQWQDKDGQTKYTTEVQAQVVQFLGSSSQAGMNSASGAASGPSYGYGNEAAGSMGAPSGGMGMNGNPGASGGGMSHAGFEEGPGKASTPSFTEDDIPF